MLNSCDCCPIGTAVLTRFVSRVAARWDDFWFGKKHAINYSDMETHLQDNPILSLGACDHSLIFNAS